MHLLPFMWRACPKCNAPVGHICEPCPKCGYRIKLTKAGEEYCKGFTEEKAIYKSLKAINFDAVKQAVLKIEGSLCNSEVWYLMTHDLGI